MCAAERTIQNDIYPVRNIALLGFEPRYSGTEISNGVNLLDIKVAKPHRTQGTKGVDKIFTFW